MAILTHRTHHGPVVGMRDGKWLSLKEHNRSYSALLQSWLRTKANGFEAFRKVMDLRSNNSNNTVFADDRGHIAYWHGNFMPVRDNRFNYDLPLDGSTMATEWKGLHSLEETIHIYDPASGFIENCNSTPFTAAGSSSPRRSDYPAYMSPDVQNLRALNALRLFDNDKKFSLEQMIAAGYDHYLSAFAILLPPLLRAYAGAGDSLKEQLGPAMGALRDWDEYSSAGSVATTLAVEWGNLMLQKLPKLRQEENEKDQVRLYQLLASKTPPAEQLALFRAALARIEATYGTWKVSWGSINRFQRSTGRLNDVFSDGGPSLPVGLASARWGSLPVFETRAIAGSKKRYGVSGNSFIAAVEFGDRVRAMTIETGGESFDPASGHFNDQAQSMIDGQLKEVYFYKQDVLRHSERSYHPGESGTK
jgi:acyl-homoserine lactone acylase PvdQ